jgi:hypothetical protein
MLTSLCGNKFIVQCNEIAFSYLFTTCRITQATLLGWAVFYSKYAQSDIETVLET